ncbi:MAG: hypothetical protein ACKV22_13475 [Bryobacteraceae bacterium]
MPQRVMSGLIIIATLKLKYGTTTPAAQGTLVRGLPAAVRIGRPMWDAMRAER